MKIEHIAIWVEDLEKMKEFYLRFFDLTCNDLYFNSRRLFSSYFLSFDSGARIDLMHKPGLLQYLGVLGERLGLARFTISLGSK